MLKKARVAVSSAVLFLFFVVLLEFRGVNENLSEILVHLQLFPSMLQALFAGMLPALVFVILLTALTFAFGRVYCSSLCPLGTLQDIFIYFRYKFKKKKAFRKSGSFRPLRYTLLALALVSAIAGNMLLLTVFEPYSNFARICVNILKPAFAYLNNSLAYMAGTFDVYFFPVIKPFKQQWPVVAWTAGFLAAIGATAFFRGRLFCNTLCPSGALLGLLARFSFFKIRIDAGACNKCGLCSAACKAECIDCAEKTIDNEKCVACFNCIEACGKNCVTYGMKPVTTKGPADEKRRIVLKGAGSLLLAAVFTALGKGKAFADALIPVKKKNPVITPPGSVSMEHFTRLCTACHLCVTACPQKVLSPAFHEYGLSGIMQPKMDYSFSYCLYKCTTCSHVCPTGAIKPLTVEQKKLTQIGKVVLEKKNCLVYDKKRQCNVCVEHCPTKAVYPVPYQGLYAPETKPDICIGCGACENTCPATPNKAIYVDGNPVHLTAKKPASKKIEKPRKAGGAEFPF